MQRRSANVTKLLSGTLRRDRTRDEASVQPHGALPDDPPAICALNESERAAYRYLIERGRSPAHREVDGLLLVQCARLLVKLEDENLDSRERRQLTGALRLVLGDVGMSLAGRLRAAPSIEAAKSATSDWDELD